MQDRFKFRYVLNNEVCEVLAFDISDGIEHKCLFLQLKDGTRKIINDYDWSKFNQCTGLKDKNGKLIYEGDIVKFAEYDWTDFSFKDWEQQKAVVIWGGDYDYPAFDLKGTDFDGTNGLSYIFGEGWTIEVIGNIYENPELLEDNK